MNIILVVGTRPNFIKASPLINSIERCNKNKPLKKINYSLVHSGQHYDYEMSQIFFQDLRIPSPDIFLGVGSGTHAEQTGRIMIEFEKVLLDVKPDMVIVFGDVNSTLAAALAAAKLNIRVAHVEAGIRSYDMAMPEEINRLLTDHLSDYLFTTSKYDDSNLKKEGVNANKIYRVGNIMVDSLFSALPMAYKSQILDRLSIKSHQYGLVTMHRAGNVDNKNNIKGILQILKKISNDITLVFPIHPRTKKNLETFGILKDLESNISLRIIEPVGYLDFLKLESNASFVITDSGGIQVETTVLNIPCFTIMNKPIWTLTHKQGTNTFIGNDIDRLITYISNNPEKQIKKSKTINLWDGETARRIVAIIINE